MSKFESISAIVHIPKNENAETIKITETLKLNELYQGNATQNLFDTLEKQTISTQKLSLAFSALATVFSLHNWPGYKPVSGLKSTIFNFESVEACSQNEIATLIQENCTVFIKYLNLFAYLNKPAEAVQKIYANLEYSNDLESVRETLRKQIIAIRPDLSGSNNPIDHNLYEKMTSEFAELRNKNRNQKPLLVVTDDYRLSSLSNNEMSAAEKKKIGILSKDNTSLDQNFGKDGFNENLKKIANGLFIQTEDEDGEITLEYDTSNIEEIIGNDTSIQIYKNLRSELLRYPKYSKSINDNLQKITQMVMSELCYEDKLEIVKDNFFDLSNIFPVVSDYNKLTFAAGANSDINPFLANNLFDTLFSDNELATMTDPNILSIIEMEIESKQSLKEISKVEAKKLLTEAKKILSKRDKSKLEGISNLFNLKYGIQINTNNLLESRFAIVEHILQDKDQLDELLRGFIQNNLKSLSSFLNPLVSTEYSLDKMAPILSDKTFPGIKEICSSTMIKKVFNYCDSLA
jgi:hypothetical protein